jgi:hypothetical protein
MEQEFRAGKKGSIKKRLQRLGIGAGVNVEASGPGVRLVSGQHRKREQNGPPCEQGVKCLLITSDGGEDVSVVIAEIRPRMAVVELSWIITVRKGPCSTYLHGLSLFVKQRGLAGNRSADGTRKSWIRAAELDEFVFGIWLSKPPRHSFDPATEL